MTTFTFVQPWDCFHISPPGLFSVFLNPYVDDEDDDGNADDYDDDEDDGGFMRMMVVFMIMMAMMTMMCFNVTQCQE